MSKQGESDIATKSSIFTYQTASLLMCLALYFHLSTASPWLLEALCAVGNASRRLVYIEHWAPEDYMMPGSGEWLKVNRAAYGIARLGSFGHQFSFFALVSSSHNTRLSPASKFASCPLFHSPPCRFAPPHSPPLRSPPHLLPTHLLPAHYGRLRPRPPPRSLAHLRREISEKK